MERLRYLRLTGRQRVGIWLTLLVLALLAAAVSLLWHLKPVMTSMATARVSNLVNRIVSAAVNEAVENGAQAVALCASGTEEIRRALERLSERGVPVATFNSDVPGGRRICYVGEDGHRAGREAGEIASCFLSRGDAFLVIYADPKYTAHKARVDGFLGLFHELFEEAGDPGGKRCDRRHPPGLPENGGNGGKCIGGASKFADGVYGEPQRPGLRGSSPQSGPDGESPHPFPRLRPGDSGAAEKRRGGFYYRAGSGVSALSGAVCAF